MGSLRPEDPGRLASRRNETSEDSKRIFEALRAGRRLNIVAKQWNRVEKVCLRAHTDDRVRRQAIKSPVPQFAIALRAPGGIFSGTRNRQIDGQKAHGTDKYRQGSKCIGSQHQIS